MARDSPNVACATLMLPLRKGVSDRFGVVLAQSFNTLVDHASCVLHRLGVALRSLSNNSARRHVMGYDAKDFILKRSFSPDSLTRLLHNSY